MSTLPWSKRRQNALYAGLLTGLLAVIALFALTYLGLDWISEWESDGTLLAWSLAVTGGLLAIAGLILRGIAVSLDRENFRVLQAAPLPAHAFRPGLPVWIEGTLQAEEPLDAPEGGGAAGYYHYERSEKAGENWKLVKNESHFATGLYLDRDGEKIAVATDGDGPRVDLPRKKSESNTSVKWSLEFLELQKPVCAAGLVDGDEGDWRLGPLDKSVPLILTPLDRSLWTEQAEATETVLDVSGLICLWIGPAMLLIGIGLLIGMGLIPALILGAAVGTSIAFAAGVYGTISQFGRLHKRLDTAWQLIQKDLDARTDQVQEVISALEAMRDQLDEEEQAVLAAQKQGTDDDDSGKEDVERCTETKEALDKWGQRFAAQNELTKHSTELIRLVTRYVPELVSPERLRAIEDELAYDRTMFNAVVGEYNNAISTFPLSLFAFILGYRKAPLWQRATPKESPATAAAE